jgi:hypothetical protein
VSSLLLGALLTLCPPGVRAQVVSALVQVSGSSPFAGSSADNVAGQPGTNYPNTEVEPWVSVCPTNASNIVCIFQQDRWNNGGCRGLVAGVSFDRGATWQLVPIPGFTLVTGGPYQRSSDPWVSFAPNGDLYVAGLGIDGTDARSGVQVSKSTDGGLHWSAPTILKDDNDPHVLNDKESVTADPTQDGYAYVVWDRVDSGFQPTQFARTKNGGQTWEAPRTITHVSTLGNQILIAPDGTLLNAFIEFGRSVTLSLIRSTDKGDTWLPALGTIHIAALESVDTTDPDTGDVVRSGGDLAAFAVDRHNGNLYAVWQDGRFSSSVINDIAFSQSTDGGLTWSSPIKINKTPTNLSDANRQAFTPAVSVAPDGTIAVSYYDFRNNTPASGALTDAWMIRCRPTPSKPATDPANWGGEVRLTDASFDIERAPDAEGLFLGDYEGLAASGYDFVSIFAQPHGSDRDSIFFRSARWTPLATISGAVTLQASASVGQSVRFTLRTTDGSADITRGLTLGSGGAFSIGDVPAVSYQLAIKGSKWLQKDVNVDASGGDVSGVTATLLTGDVNDDNAVNITDLGLLADSFGKSQGQTGFNPNADLNGDNAVNITDLGLLADNFGRQGDP